MNIFIFDTQFILTIKYKYKEKFMSQFKIVDHSKNQIYKQFEDSLYGYDTVPEGYEGTKVSGYTRNCYKHSGQRIPRLTDMSKDEMEWWLAKLI